jgi:hypothetical protein
MQNASEKQLEFELTLNAFELVIVQRHHSWATASESIQCADGV